MKSEEGGGGERGHARCVRHAAYYSGKNERRRKYVLRAYGHSSKVSNPRGSMKPGYLPLNGCQLIWRHMRKRGGSSVKLVPASMGLFNCEN